MGDRLLSEMCCFFLITLQHICILGAAVYLWSWWGCALVWADPRAAGHRRRQQGLRLHVFTSDTGGLLLIRPVAISQRGKSTLETFHFTTGIHLQFTEQFFSTRMRPQLPLCWVSTPSVMLLVFFFFFFSKRCVTGLWFFSPVTVHRKCVVLKQVPVTVSTPRRGPQG